MLIASLRTRFAVFWVSTTIVSLALGAIWWTLVRHGTDVQTKLAKQEVTKACLTIQSDYEALLASGSALDSGATVIMLDHALAASVGVEGGLWGPQTGFLAYSFPTYEGHGVKRDVPPAEMKHIVSLATQVLAENTAKVDFTRGTNQSLVLTACPLPPSSGLAAWTMTRVNAAASAAYDYMALGMFVLLAFVVLSGLWLGRMLMGWSKQLRVIETCLRSGSLRALPQLPLSGDQELDSVSISVNAFSERLNHALKEAELLAQKLALQDRLASLGRMAAVVAHEIRNPLATIRIKAENALASPERRLPGALDTILVQTQRVEGVIANILQMFRKAEVQIEPTSVESWLNERLQAIAIFAERKGVRVEWQNSVEVWSFDRIKLGQAVDNLLMNAVQHSAKGQAIQLVVSQEQGLLKITVRDFGPGIAPAVADRLFEPFVTGRADGLGLGLMVVRDTVEAHHGEVRTLPVAAGACFQVEVP